MRILMVGINYRPELTSVAPYTAGFAEHLVLEGHDVRVVTGMPSYPEWRVHESYRRVLWAREIINDVDVRRRWVYVPSSPTPARRAAYELSFLLSGLSALARWHPDVIVGITPSLSGAMLARVASMRYRVPYSLIIHDMMGEAVVQSGLMNRSRLSRVVAGLEGWAVRDASSVGVVAEGFRAHVESLGVPADRVMRIRNWTHISAPSIRPDEVRRMLGLPLDRVLCLHAGNMGHKQGLDTLVHCAKLADGVHPELFFALVGGGSQEPELRRLADSLELTNLVFLPVQSSAIFTSLLAAADILLVVQKGSVVDMSLPSKVTSYLASGRPVVASVASESETARELKSADAALIVPAASPQDLLGGLLSICREPVRAQMLADNGRLLVRKTLSAEVCLSSLSALVETALRS